MRAATVGRENYVTACDLRILTTPAEEELHDEGADSRGRHRTWYCCW
jgi:hypothetical protein